MLDAYAVRKAIPRIVLAVIGINLSIYFCVALVDITNVVAQGLSGLIVGPFATSGMTVFDQPTDPANSIAAGVGVAIGAGPMVAAVTSAFAAIATQGALTVVGGAVMSLLFMLIPIACIALAILVTVVIRQALLFFLIIVSPVAIVCSILPGTEKYFQKWWDLFVKTLIVYPIIALIFALSDVFASIIGSNNGGGLTGIAQTITTIVVIYAPVFMIPFAFRFAGGAMATLTKAATGMGDRMAQSGFVKNRREYYGQQNKDNMVRGRAEAYRNAGERAQTSTGLRRRSATWQARRLNGYRKDILDREAELNERYGKAQAQTTGNGDDINQRAYSVNKSFVDREKAAGRGQGVLWQVGENGVTQYKTAGGKWVTGFDVDEANRKYGRRNVTQWQQSMAYEMRKAATQQDQDNLVRSFSETAAEWGMSSNQANGAWIGAGFANQDSNLQWKHGSWSKQSDGSFGYNTGGGKLITEMDEKKDGYSAARNNADTWTTMGQEVQAAHAARREAKQQIDDLSSRATLSSEESLQLKNAQKTYSANDETLKRASRIVNSIRTVQPEVDKDGKPTGERLVSIGAGAAPRVQEEMRAFAEVADTFAGTYKPQENPMTREPDAVQPAGNVNDAINRRQATGPNNDVRSRDDVSGR